MKILSVPCVTLMLFLFGMPRPATAPGVLWKAPVVDPSRADHQKAEQVSVQLLRHAGDLVAEIAFSADPHDRRSASVAAARRLRIDAATAPARERRILLDLATALEHYDLIGIIAASERRLALENTAQSHRSQTP